MIKKILVLFSVMLMISSFAACSYIDEDQLLSELPALIKEGRQLLDIVYGDGLPVDEKGTEAARKGYFPVSEDSEYKSIDELKSAFGEVFTESYTTVLYINALNGVSYDSGNISPRYMESEAGILLADTNYESQIARREPVYESIRITRTSRNMAEFEITMVYADGTEEPDTVIVKKENGKWKLDSAVL